LLFAVIFIVIVVTATVGTLSGDYREYTYVPGDTRIITGISNSFCSGISLTDKSTYTPTLYSLKKRPLLTSFTYFVVPQTRTQTINGYGDYIHWRYYLNSGSKFSVSMCLLSSSSALSLLFIKGRRNFHSWTSNAGENHVHSTYSISDVNCTSSNPPMTFTVPAAYEDDWYIVVYNRGSSSNRFDIIISVNRTEYTIIPSDVRQECTPSGTTPCNIPLTDGDTYLVRIDPGSSPVYEDSVDTCLNCVANGGVITAIVIAPILIFVGVVVVVIGISVCIACWSKRTVATTASRV
jgi:hypothetical protein